MPIYTYHCEHCGEYFDDLRLAPSEEELKFAECPNCHKRAARTYRGYRVAVPSASRNSELLEDEEPYRKMHYHEKRGEWEAAAKAAEGVSEFARKKFQQKAQQGDEA